MNTIFLCELGSLITLALTLMLLFHMIAQQNSKIAWLYKLRDEDLGTLSHLEMRMVKIMGCKQCKPEKKRNIKKIKGK